MEEYVAIWSSVPTPATYCVTGASGFIGSWLVKSLLERGHHVHATVRDPGPVLRSNLYEVSAKTPHLRSLGRSHGNRLRIFQADLLEEGSFDEAVEGCCYGVFHVAAGMQFNVPDEGEDSLESNVLEPARRGTLNILQSCLKSKKPVKRIVFTSSISTITAKDNEGKWRASVDECCQTSIRHVRENKASGWVYVLSKILTENTALEFAQANGIDVVSIITPTIAGPFLTSHVPSSLRVLLSPITGELEYLKILKAVNSRMGSLALAHTEDICRAHIFLMEQPNAHGRYLCSAGSFTMSALVQLLAKAYPSSERMVVEKDDIDPVPCEVSSKKLKDLGFRYEFGVDDIVREAVACCLARQFLPPLHRNDGSKNSISKDN